MKIQKNRVGNMTTLSLLAAMAMVGGDAMGATWLAGAPDLNWENAANWNTPTVPGASDLAFIGLATGTVQLNSNQTVEAFRTANGRDVNHIGGTLTIAGSGGQDSFLGEFNNANWDNTDTIYTMSGTAKYNQTDGRLFILARGGDGQLSMSNNTEMTSNGELWFGMDNAFVGVLSNNAKIETTNGKNVEISRFVSPSSSLTLNDSASLQVDGTLRMSQGTTPGGDPFAGTSGDSILTLNGSSLDIDLGGLTMRSKATLEFIADVSGISTIGVDGAIELLDNRGEPAPELVVDLSLYSGSGPITLIDNTTLDAVNGTFLGLGEGAVVSGTGGLTISYLGGDGNDIVLVPEPASLALLAMGGLLMTSRRRRA